MFSVRSTRGSISVISADTVVSYLIFELVLPFLPQAPEWLSPANLYGHLIFSIFTLIVVFSGYIIGLYSYIQYMYPFDLLKKIIPAFLLSFLCLATFTHFNKNLSLINFQLLIPLGLIYLYLSFFRFILLFVMPGNREQILILGATDLAQKIIKESHRKRFKGYSILGIVTSLESQAGTDFHGIPILGSIHEIEKAVREHSIDSIVVTLRERRGRLPIHELLKYKMMNIRIQEGSNFYENVKQRIIIDEFLKPSWIIFEDGFYHTSLHRYIKRAQGIFVSLILLVIFSPILLLVGILIKLESNGPVFFQQNRIGHNGKNFSLLKFRSMYHSIDKINKPMFAQKNDPRITRIGRVIRRIRIDEVPQFINIFKGDMDLVGPRPEQPFFVKQLEKTVPYYNLRHAVRPGLTGWAQVNFHYGDTLEDGREKLMYDLYYVKHFSWSLDLLIIFLTLKEVIFGRGQ